MKKELDYYLNQLIEHSEDAVAIFDFDYTLTTNLSESSIGVFTKYLPPEYKKRKEVIDKISKKWNSRFLLKIIWKYKLNYLSKFYNENVLNKIDIKSDFILNDFTIKILRKCCENNIRTIIYSSGLKSVIELVLKYYKINYINLEIIANDINVDCKLNSKIVTPKNKKIKFPKNEYVILFGDKKNDLRIAKKSVKILIKNSDYKILDSW